MLPGYTVQAGLDANYAVSQDERRIAFAMKDQRGISHLWVAPLDRRSSPQQLPSANSEDSPLFLPDGDLVFRTTEGELNFVYRMRPDGSGRRKVISDPILDLFAASPDGKWLIASTKGQNEEHPYRTLAVSLEGSELIPEVSSAKPSIAEHRSTDVLKLDDVREYSHEEIGGPLQEP